MNINQQRGVWFAIAVLACVLAAMAIGVLAYLAGEHPARAVITGAAAFVATMTLATAVIALLVQKAR